MAITKTLPISHAPQLRTKTLVRAQAFSGLLLAVFLTLHLVNLGAALFGQQAYDSVMQTFRRVYQTPVYELVGVVGAALVHMVASVMRIRRRRADARRADALRRDGGDGEPAKGATKPPWRVRLHRYSAYYLLVFFVGHMLATRLPSLLGENVSFSFLTYSLNVAPAYFYPYYALLAASGCYHMSHGVLVALRVARVPLPRAATAPNSRIFWGWTAALAVGGLVSVMALGGLLYSVDTSAFADWNAFYRDMLGDAAPQLSSHPDSGAAAR